MCNEEICIACKEPINPGATKCHHCEQYQNWKRHLTFSGMILSLLVALISILVVAVPVFKKAFTVERAELQLAVFKGDFNSFEFLLSNLGGRSAVVTDISISHENKGIKSYNLLYPEILGRVVEPNKTYKVEAKTTKDQFIPYTTPPLIAAVDKDRWDTCNLSVELIHFDGAIEIQNIPFKCSIPKK